MLSIDTREPYLVAPLVGFEPTFSAPVTVKGLEDLPGYSGIRQLDTISRALSFILPVVSR